MEYPIYHETLSLALQAAEAHAVCSRAMIDRDALREEFATGGIPYGTTRNADLPIQFYKGKPTRKGFHVSIYRMDSGRYELTCYIL
jgi:hypothetical protein